MTIYHPSNSLHTYLPYFSSAELQQENLFRVYEDPEVEGTGWSQGVWGVETGVIDGHLPATPLKNLEAGGNGSSPFLKMQFLWFKAKLETCSGWTVQGSDSFLMCCQAATAAKADKSAEGREADRGLESPTHSPSPLTLTHTFATHPHSIRAFSH
ncbi:unnamed protein product [Pleuronectes platessa]|uniref:Uncharacterized protein n=1 Tax=Pleuronectes platessa TaxID=8262 RepID=A0A9N7Z5I5_PLEPL|nr:unnamed protein product [Pleuronectes platessa]